jgi:hypothetical protein
MLPSGEKRCAGSFSPERRLVTRVERLAHGRSPRVPFHSAGLTWTPVGVLFCSDAEHHPLLTGQAFLRRLFFPVRPRVSAPSLRSRRNLSLVEGEAGEQFWTDAGLSISASFFQSITGDST